MSQRPEENHGGEHQTPDWNPAKPAVVPEPTVWPAALALSVTLGLWGLVTSVIISLVGIGLLIVSLAGWIGEIRHERRTF